ncbi:MAG: type II secretion system F family protein [Pseudomonadota bacterium]
MPNFEYRGTFSSGAAAEGNIQATNEEAAIQVLAGRGIRVNKLKDKRLNLTATELFNKTLGIGLANPQELINFARQMHNLAKSGVPIIRSMRLIADATRGKALKEALVKVADGLESGHSLSASMKMQHTVFPELMISMIDVGESTGNLDTAFEQISQYMERDEETRKRIKSATRYPSFVILTIAFAIVAINIWVIPSFVNFFSKFHAALPLPTRILMASSSIMLHYWWLMMLMLIAMVAGFVSFRNSESGGYWWDRMILRVPLLGSIILRSLLARFCRCFSMMTSSGVPLLQVLTTVSKTVENTYLSRRILEMRSSIERGESLGRAASASQMFTPLVLQMIVIGEETGNVDSMLKQVAISYESDVDYELKALSQAIEPILITVVAGIVLVLALGIFLPMWNLSTVALHG